MRKRLGIGLVLCAALAAAQAHASSRRTEVKKTPLRRGVQVAPLPAGEAVHAHPPFKSRDCGVCHERREGPDPGPIRHASVNDQCFECHEDVRAVMSRKYTHVPATEACTDCHNPHNSNEPRLLAKEAGELCLSCHAGIKAQLARGKVQHEAVIKDRKCANCHNPHAANVEKLLVALPFDLCVNCHSQDGMVASDGKPMANYKKWLDENRVWHAPVAAKDCSACHLTHAGDNYRLLVAPYSPEFYAPYDRKAYALCYGCHNEEVVAVPRTTTLTSFRDGDRNLHYVHVHKARGRTCRACHEVHASKQDHHIRESVPYGVRSWNLKIGYTKLASGGSCAKTCHDTKTYDNGRTRGDAGKKP